jgi:hypothetical protein
VAAVDAPGQRLRGIRNLGARGGGRGQRHCKPNEVQQFHGDLS